MQLNLFPSIKANPITSRFDESSKIGITLLEFCRQESELNDRIYGISYSQRCELMLLGYQFPWFKINEPIAKINVDWCKVYQEFQASRVDVPKSIVKTPKPIVQWSLDAKRRVRLKKLHDRLHKQYSIPDLFHAAIGRALLKNPNYYGVCVLPSEQICHYTPIINPRQQAAIDRENQYRAGQ